MPDVMRENGVDRRSRREFNKLCRGGMAKWTKARDCKSLIVGSNPTAASTSQGPSAHRFSLLDKELGGESRTTLQCRAVHENAPQCRYLSPF